MKVLLTILLLCCFQQLPAQDSIVVTRGYSNAGPSTAIDSAYFLLFPNTIFISLDEGFDDSLHITCNGVPVFDERVKTNESINYAGSFGITFTDSSKTKELVIVFTKTGKCIREKLNLNYKLLQVSEYYTWQLMYSNHFYLRE